MKSPMYNRINICVCVRVRAHMCIYIYTYTYLDRLVKVVGYIDKEKEKEKVERNEI